MAGNLPCQSDDANVAMFIVTNLDNGESQTLCPACFLQFCSVVVESMTGLPVSDILKDLESKSDDDTVTDVEGDTDVGDGYDTDVEGDTEASVTQDADTPTDDQ